MSVTPEPQQTIALVVRHNTAGIDEHVQAIVDFLQGAGYRVVFEPEDGRAAEVKLQQPSGWRLFDQAALAQAQACRFTPARRGAQVEESWVEFPVRFSLQG